MGAKGSAKTGGRKKGTPNKSTLTIQEELKSFDNGAGFNLVQEMMNLYTLIHADNPLVAVKILTSLMEYVYPKRRSIDLRTEESVLIRVLSSDVNGRMLEIRKDGNRNQITSEARGGVLLPE